jgi:hypothetical protein
VQKEIDIANSVLHHSGIHDLAQLLEAWFSQLREHIPSAGDALNLTLGAHSPRQ